MSASRNRNQRSETPSWRWWLKALTPPIVVIGVKRALRPFLPSAAIPPPDPAAAPGGPPEWEYVPEGWSRDVPGWNVDAVAQAYAARWTEFTAALEGSDPLAVSHEAPSGEPLVTHDLGAQTMLLSFAYVTALASRGCTPFRVLDWGGGLGHYAAIARAALPRVALDYTCHELAAVAEVGRSLQPEVRFCTDDSCLAGRYDLVVASSSLQYAEDWRALLARLAAAAEGYVLVTRVPVALGSSSFVVLQRAHRYGYATEYLGWVISRGELLDAARAAGLQLVREFLLDAWLSADGAPEAPTPHRGFLFRAGERENGQSSRSIV